MSIYELHKTMSTDFTHKIADWTDSTAYAYVTQQMISIRDAGLDPMDYEVVFISDETPQYMHDGTGMKIDKRMQVRRIEE